MKHNYPPRVENGQFAPKYAVIGDIDFYVVNRYHFFMGKSEAYIFSTKEDALRFIEEEYDNALNNKYLEVNMALEPNGESALVEFKNGERIEWYLAMIIDKR